VAEASGVRLAAHPDDPPLPTLRGQPRLVYQPQLYQRLIDLHPSPANQLEFCLGTLAEMPAGDVYEAVEQYSRQRRIGYVHLRNIASKAPHYRETFIDDGDVDMLKAMRVYKEVGFDGMMMPDHVPSIEGDTGNQQGFAFALGYIKALIAAVSAEG
jgi:mannonate dehydratase